MKKVVAIYHKDCVDGTTSAAVVLKKFPEAKVYPIPRGYTKEDLEPILSTLTEENEIYTVDGEMGAREILDLGFKVTTIDHHIGERENLDNLAKENSNYTFIFDNDKSGASLSWNYFFPGEEMPEMIKYVEDFDLWNWKYRKETENVMGYLSIFRNNPEKTLELMNNGLEEIMNKGEVISTYTESQIEEQKKTEPVQIKIGENTVPAFNAPMSYKSFLGDFFSKKLGKTVLIFKIDGGKVKMSFRGHDEHTPSALELASLVGGGGHRNSAGGAMPLYNFLEMLVK
ncbi:MAG TPA: phosphoesterase [Candidatus Paceibacterota bacterium]